VLVLDQLSYDLKHNRVASLTIAPSLSIKYLNANYERALVKSTHDISNIIVSAAQQYYLCELIKIDEIPQIKNSS
jgi:hypothetical protein